MPPPGLPPIPQTTNFIVIFPRNEQNNTFDSRSYSPDQTDGKVTNEEINPILKEIETAHAPFAAKTKTFDTWYKAALILIACIYVPLIIWLRSVSYLYVVLAIISYLFLLVNSLAWYGKAVFRYNKESRDICQTIIDRHNQSFVEKGLRWVLNPIDYPRWIELWKEYCGLGPGQMQVRGQYIYFPPGSREFLTRSGYSNQADQIGIPIQYENPYPDVQNNNEYIPPNQV